MFYDKFVYLCNQKNVSPSKAAMDAGISKSLVTKWRVKRVRTPSADVIEKLCSYFGLSVSELLSEDTGAYSRCVGCGLQYDPHDDEDRQLHNQRHNAWIAATQKFGFCWHYIFREDKKADARSIVNDPNVPLANKVEAQVIVFKALFSRSLESSGYDLDHVDFDTYIAMLLDQGKGTHNIPGDIYDALVERYGKKPGMPKGTYYKAKKAVSTLTDKSGHGSTPKNMNILRIAGRDGSYEERYLTDGQLAAVKAIIDQLPDASEDL